MTARLAGLVSLLIILAAGCAGSRQDAPSPADATLTAVGDPAPPLEVDSLAGVAVDLAALRGKVVLLNWWATWCPPCRQEMPHLRDRIWQRWGGRDDFVLLSVAREETPDVVAGYLADQNLGWTFATDPDRHNYARYAEAHIPRSYVIDRDGRIRFQSVGFTEEDFAAMVASLEALLDD